LVSRSGIVNPKVQIIPVFFEDHALNFVIAPDYLHGGSVGYFSNRSIHLSCRAMPTTASCLVAAFFASPARRFARFILPAFYPFPKILQ
jgi:hypothetical protein